MGRWGVVEAGVVVAFCVAIAMVILMRPTALQCTCCDLGECP